MMRELTQEEFDELLERRREVWEFIKYGSPEHRIATSRADVVLPRKEVEPDPCWEDLIKRPTLSRFENFYDFGSKYIVHYEDLSEVDI